MGASPKTWTDNSPPTCNASDLNGFNEEINNLILSAGISLDYNNHDQTAQAVTRYAADGNYYVDSGSANAYVLSAQSPKKAPVAYTEGMIVRWIPQNGNTGPSTVNVSTLGLKSILSEGETPLVGGEISANLQAIAFYNGASFILMTNQINSTSDTNDNVIIGGNFGTNPWQRGSTFTIGSGGSVYTADRFKAQIGQDSTANITVSRSSTVPSVAIGGGFSSNSIKVLCNVIDTSSTGSSTVTITYDVEGYDFQKIAQQYFIIRFCVRASKTGIYCLALKNTGTDQSYIAEYSIDFADTWEEKILLIPSSPSAGTWDYGGGKGLSIDWKLKQSALVAPTANTWLPSNYDCSSNQVNLVDTVNATFYLNMIKIEPGKIYTGFSEPLRGDIFKLCQRYFFKTYIGSGMPGDTGQENGSFLYRLGSTLPSNTPYASYPLPEMRTSPTVTICSPTTGAVNKIRDYTAGADLDATATFIGSKNLSLSYTGVASIPAGDLLLAHIVANAEL